MTNPNPLRAELVERMARAACPEAFADIYAHRNLGDSREQRVKEALSAETKSLTAALAFLAERGCKVVGPDVTPTMNDAARDWSKSKYGQPVGKDGSEGCWTAMLSAAPNPLEENADAN